MAAASAVFNARRAGVKKPDTVKYRAFDVSHRLGSLATQRECAVSLFFVHCAHSGGVETAVDVKDFTADT